MALRFPSHKRDRIFCSSTSPIDHPPREAIIVFSVDDCERRWPVRLPEGLAVERERVAIAKV
jgi:hypothetical protein